jgi:hypothetical protein
MRNSRSRSPLVRAALGVTVNAPAVGPRSGSATANDRADTPVVAAKAVAVVDNPS